MPENPTALTTNPITNPIIKLRIYSVLDYRQSFSECHQFRTLVGATTIPNAVPHDVVILCVTALNLIQEGGKGVRYFEVHTFFPAIAAIESA
jgi:hypothetical protein